MDIDKMGDTIKDLGNLQVISIVGFDGKIGNGIHIHPDGVHYLYPFGNAVTIQNTKNKHQKFLLGHTNLVSAVALSSSGNYVASGQINFMGFKATVILWDFQTQTRLGDYEIHQVRVEFLTFTCGDEYLLSLGGRDDARIVVYDVKAREPICGSYGNGANTGIALTLASTKQKCLHFLSGGDRTLRLWQIDATRRKLSFMDVNFNRVKRIINCIAVSDNDNFAYCGTTSGDLIKLSLSLGQEKPENGTTRAPIVLGVYGKKIESKKKTGVVADCYSQGVAAIIILKNGQLVIGAGDGTVEVVEETEYTKPTDNLSKKVKDPLLPKLKSIRSHNVDSGVSTMRLIHGRLLIGTIESETFSIGLEKWDLKLITTCHTSTIYDVCFPCDMSSVLATSSKDTVRVWNAETCQELLRIRVANMTCSGVIFRNDGCAVITSWNDGKIRAFTPQTGKLMYIIHNAHNKGVSAIASTKDDKILVSGGGEGQVRVWGIADDMQTLKAVLQEHKGPVSAIHVNYGDDEAASASTDGSCIIWDILKCTRKNIIFANTLFMAVRFHTSDCQILTAGSDRKVCYWETFDGSLIRSIEASAAAAINTIDISPCGEYFVTGGNDQMIKLWRYEEGQVTHVGLGHAGIITQARFSPDGKHIVSVSTDGAMFRWLNPHYNNSDTKTSKEVREIDTVRSEPGDKVDKPIKETINDSQSA